MKAAKFTDDIGEQIVSALREGYDKKSQCVVTHVIPDGDVIQAEGAICSAPAAEKLNLETCKIDYFGILYQGWSGVTRTQNIDTPEAKMWLEHLLDPEGPFKEVLPYLYHVDPDQVVKDRGFVFHSLDLKRKSPVNAGLLWTFIQATRYFYENPRRMARFLYAREHYPKTIATLITISLHPTTNPGTYRTDPAHPTINADTLWTPTVVAHGEPLGTQGWKRAGPFLSGKLTPRSYHSPARSSFCFGGEFMYSYGNPPAGKTLAAWVSLFEKARDDGTAIIGA